MSSLIGAKRLSISISTTVVRPPGPSSFCLTLPTFTPASRTSASATSSDASGNAALKR